MSSKATLILLAAAVLMAAGSLAAQVDPTIIPPPPPPPSDTPLVTQLETEFAGFDARGLAKYRVLLGLRPAVRDDGRALAVQVLLRDTIPPAIDVVCEDCERTVEADPSYPSPLAALDRVVMLDADLLWREEFNQPEQGYRNFFQTWLRACADISQSGRPVVLFGAGTSVPHNLEPLIERRYFSALHYLALVCQSDELERRIRARDYRPDSDDPNFISEHRDFNRWFIQNAHTTEPPIELIETTYLPLPQVARRVLGWITAIIAQASFRKT